MTTELHTVSREEIMAFLDGELIGAQALAVSAHLGECGECLGIAEEFGGISRALASWSVEAVPATVEGVVGGLAAGCRAREAGRKGTGASRVSVWSWRPWVVSGGTVAAIFVVAALLWPNFSSHKYSAPQGAWSGIAKVRTENESISDNPADKEGKAMNYLSQPAVGIVAGGGGGGVRKAIDGAPMIARTVNLELRVRDIATARMAVERILGRYGGYAAQLNLHSSANEAAGLEASLRVPVQNLAAATDALKALGMVEDESQSSEDVTPQHADLEQRLKTARDTEERFRGVLQNRTGSVKDVLDVQEQLAQLRNEIESMEAEQKTLEHRVDFATIELKMHTDLPLSQSAPFSFFGMRMGKALSAGYQNAAGSLMGLLLFLAEYGPAILIWVVLLGLPGFFVWRRYRRVRSRI